MADGKIVNTWVSDDKDMLRSIERMNRQITKLQDKLRNTGIASKKSGDQATKGFEQATKVAKSFVGALGLAGGVAGALGLVNKKFDTWVKNLKEISIESRKASNDIIALAAIQEGGKAKESVMAAARLGRQYGVNRGEAFNTIQALQSASKGGTLAEGLAAGETVFAAARAAGETLSITEATDVEGVGAALGLPPGAAVRRAYRVGQLSSKSPGAVTKGITKSVYFGEEENLLANAVARELLSTKGPDEMGTFLKAAGLATGGKYAALYKEKLGVPLDATHMQRMQALADKGIGSGKDPIADFLKFGITETRQAESLALTIPHLEKIKKTRADLARTAVPGLFQSEWERVSGELPRLGQADELKRMETLFKDVSGGLVPGTEKRSRKASAVQIRYKLRAAAVRSLGLEETLLGRDRITAEGDLTPYGVKEMMASEAVFPMRDEGPGSRPSAAMMPGGVPGPTVEEEIRNEMVRLRKTMERNRPAVRQDGPSQSSW